MLQPNPLHLGDGLEIGDRLLPMGCSSLTSLIEKLLVDHLKSIGRFEAKAKKK
jgi:hypothetical protein